MTVLVIMGVSGSGKTTVATMVARALRRRFVDADEHHPAANREKMAAGRPLDDDDRAPWLDGLNALLRGGDGDVVLACSALTDAYRRRLLADVDDVTVVFLRVDATVARQRVRDRAGHFMPETLIDSQFATLEAPGADEAEIVDADRPVDEVVAEVIARVS